VSRKTLNLFTAAAWAVFKPTRSCIAAAVYLAVGTCRARAE